MARARRTTHDAAFLQAIREAPEDNVPRLIYADWLADQPDPVQVARGEFIRVQCQLAGIPRNDPRWEALVERARGLLRRYRNLWWRNRGYCLWTGDYERGFIERFGFDLTGYLAFAPRVAAYFPFVNLSLVGDGRERSEADLQALATSPHLASVRTLELRNLGEEITPLLGRADVNRVVDLRLHQCVVGPLGEGIPRPGVRSLALESFSPESVRNVLRSPLLPGVETLTFDAALAQEVAACLPGAPMLSALRKLDFNHMTLGADLLAGLLRDPNFAVTNLNVAGVYSYSDGGYWGIEHEEWIANVDDEGVRALAQAPVAARLRTLDVSYNHLTSETIYALASSPYLQGLRSLSIGERPGRLTQESLDRLRERFGKRLHIK